MSNEKYFFQRKNIVFRQEGRNALLFDPETGIVRILNETGIFIWKLCNGKYTFNEILKQLIGNYEVHCKKKDKIVKECKNFISSLKEKNLIQVVEK